MTSYTIVQKLGGYNGSASEILEKKRKVICRVLVNLQGQRIPASYELRRDLSMEILYAKNCRCYEEICINPCDIQVFFRICASQRLWWFFLVDFVWSKIATS